MTQPQHIGMARHLRREDLAGKVIDADSHIGVALREAAQINFPYCSSAEDLAYRHKANGVDFGVVFPISPALHYDLQTVIETGELRPAARPISRVPYERENRLLLTDVYRFCPEHSGRFLPFISVDPGRLIDEQIANLEELEQEFPIYGVKIHPLMAQSKALALLDVGAPLLAFFAERDWPVLFHATLDPTDPFSQVADILQVAERHPELRFCMAHCIGCHRPSFERAAALPNMYVDTAALKIQVELFRRTRRAGTPGRPRCWTWITMITRACSSNWSSATPPPCCGPAIRRITATSRAASRGKGCTASSG